MPQPVTVRAVEVRPGQYRWYGYPEHRFISGEEAIRRLRPSIAGFHGWRGRLQRYEAVAQTLGPGIPTPGHRYWKAVEDIAQPTEALPPRAMLQYETTVTYVTPEGREVSRSFYTPIGEGYDVEAMESRIHAYATTRETPPGAALAEEEWFTVVSRSTRQLTWTMVGPGPL